MPTSPQAELILDARATLGEGPVWDAATASLHWVDISAGVLHRLDTATGRDTAHTIGEALGCAVLRARGGFVLGLQRGLAFFDPQSGSLTRVADPESATTGNRFNDGKCDPAGRLWAGTMGKPGSAALYRLDGDGTLHRMATGITCSNGLAWSADGRTMYYTDTPTFTIVAYPFDAPSGAIGEPRAVVSVPRTEGGPDGMAIDAEGLLWVGHWDGGQVVRWDPRSGQAVARIRVPASRATSCAFGGPQLDRLYITSARQGLKPEQLAREPHAGGVFVADPGVRGAPVPAFAG